LHLDGARLFNALVETGESPRDWGAAFDSISICLSKGLGAPVGSLLLGSTELVARARRLRKVMGGGMRQAGFLAAAGLYALQNNVARLADDNARARRVGEVLTGAAYVAAVRPVQSNIVIFDTIPGLTAEAFLAYLAEHGIQAVAFGPQTVRLTFHLHITDDMVDILMGVLRAFSRIG
jgi:threonine aldolase